MKECIAVIKNVKPKVFILENVKHFRSVQEGKPYRYLMGQLGRIGGYHIYVNLLNTKDYGIPQNRERLFIVGIKKRNQVKVFLTPPKQISQSLEHFLLHKPNHPQTFLTDRDIAMLKQYKGIDFNKLGKKNYVVAKNRYIVCMNDVCPTLATERKHYLVKYKRYLHLEEYLYLQGFPSTFKVVVSATQIIKQAGNSMSVNVLKAIFQTLEDCTNCF